MPAYKAHEVDSLIDFICIEAILSHYDQIRLIPTTRTLGEFYNCTRLTKETVDTITYDEFGVCRVVAVEFKKEKLG